jgi:hypothetical protein
VKRCAIYARYSSDLQSPTSIEDQHQLCRACAERRGWAVVSLYEMRRSPALASNTARSGAVARGLSAGGRLYGYRTVPVTHEAKPSDRGTPTRFEVETGEAEIVRESSARTRRGGA